MSIFDAITRGHLEKIMDQKIDGIPLMMRIIRDPKVAHQYMLSKEQDFVLGWLIGSIVEQCMNTLTIFRGGKNIEFNDMIEINKILERRMPEIFRKIQDQG